MRKLLTMLINAFPLMGCRSSDDAEKLHGKRSIKTLYINNVFLKKGRKYGC